MSDIVAEKKKNVFGPVFVLMFVFFFLLSYQETIEPTAEELIETTHSLLSLSSPLFHTLLHRTKKKDTQTKSILPQRFSRFLPHLIE